MEHSDSEDLGVYGDYTEQKRVLQHSTTARALLSSLPGLQVWDGQIMLLDRLWQ